MVARRQVVSLANCASCHSDLKFVHGGTRNNTQECTICHNPTLSDGTSGQSVNFATQIHSIHRGEALENPYTLGSTNYQEVRFPGDLRNCTTCHLPRHLPGGERRRQGDGRQPRRIHQDDSSDLGRMPRLPRRHRHGLSRPGEHDHPRRELQCLPRRRRTILCGPRPPANLLSGSTSGQQTPPVATKRPVGFCVFVGACCGYGGRSRRGLWTPGADSRIWSQPTTRTGSLNRFATAAKGCGPPGQTPQIAERGPGLRSPRESRRPSSFVRNSRRAR